jgi:hypothetical protein
VRTKEPLAAPADPGGAVVAEEEGEKRSGWEEEGVTVDMVLGD